MKKYFSLHVGFFIFPFLVFLVRTGLSLEKNLIGAVSINEIETIFTLQETEDGLNTLLLKPLDPGMVFHKVIVDCGGHEQACSKAPGSPCREQ